MADPASDNPNEPSTPQRDHTKLDHPILTAGDRQKGLLLRIVRTAFVVLFITVLLLSIFAVGETDSGVDRLIAIRWYVAIPVALTLVVAAVAADVLTPVKKISALVSILFGMLAALVATWAIGSVIDLITMVFDLKVAAPATIASIKVLIGICLTYLAISTVLQTQDDFRLVIPYVEFAKQIRGPRPLLLDTSALIDARIVDIARTGVVQTPMLIPAFVVNELQLLADSSDKLTRAKGRRGLSVVQRMTSDAGLDVSIDDTPTPGKAVDRMLIELATRLPAGIITTDSGLAKVAALRSVPVVNVHELALAVRSALVPGERIRVHLVKEGEQAGQGVGYLEDGTMVVVDGGDGAIGTTVEPVVEKSIQTSAGRMVFAQLDGESPSTPETPEPDTIDAEHTNGTDSSTAPEAESEHDETAPPPRRPGPFPPKAPRPTNPARNPRR